MDLRHLRTFVAVAEHLHFRRAAERLFLSQPTVTTHIQALERELGAALFERGGARTRLEPAGERLLPYARRVLALEAEAQGEIRAWRLRFDERLRIAASIFVAGSALPPALRRLVGERPRIDVALRTTFSAEVVVAVAQGEADLGLSRVAPAGEGVAGRQLMGEPVVAVAPAAWGDLSSTEALAEALAGHPLLTHNHPGYWDRLLARLQALGWAHRPMEVRQVDVTKRLIEEGLGLSFLPASAVAGCAGLRVLHTPTDLSLPEVGTWAIWPQDRPPTPAGERLLHLLYEGGVPDGSGGHLR